MLCKPTCGDYSDRVAANSVDLSHVGQADVAAECGPADV